MGYEYVRAVCLFCNAIVEGNQRFMVGGRNLPTRRGYAPKWLKEKPEYKWTWNGLGNAIFYLCPEHSGDEHCEEAFKWAQKHSRTNEIE